MQLVIAEKPSVAADLARALQDSFEEREGFWEGSRYLISWAVGHLLELSEPEDYDPAYKTWLLDSLPILPETFRRRPRSGQTRQLQLLKKLARRDDVEALVNACDAAREGELIFREIADYAAVEKPVYRLWLQSMTTEAVRQAFEEMKPAESYDGLGAAAYSRAEADWLIGMNATRAITKRLKGRRERGVWSAGRVQTPTLALLVHREMKVLAHVPRPFWRLRGRFQAARHEYEGLYRTSRTGKDGEKIWDRQQAEQLQSEVDGQPARVVEEVSESQRKPPPLHSLTSLQKEANGRYGLSARRTLAAAQRLYEGHKLLTYPRTDSAALPEDYRGHVGKVLGMLASEDPAGFFSEEGRSEAIGDAARIVQKEGLQNEQRNFDDSKVGDHFAIIPTGSTPSTPLGGDDAKVFELVTRRFLAAFLGPSTWQKVVRETIIKSRNSPEEHVFYTESKRLVIPGWQLVDRRPPVSEVLPDLGVAPGDAAGGEVLAVDVEEDATRPPARYTEAGLLKAMETASDLDLDFHEEIDDDEVVEALRDKGLGTPATRADIIEALIAKGYVSRAGKTLRPSAKGITLIDFLERIEAEHLAKAQLTAEMEFHLYQVEEGKRARAEYMKEVEDSVKELVEQLRTFSYDDLYDQEPPLGECPRDGVPVVEGLKGYRCSKPALGDRYEVRIKSTGKEASQPLAELVAKVSRALEELDGVAEVSSEPKRTTAKVFVRMDRKGNVAELRDSLAQRASGAVPAGDLKELSVVAVEPEECGWTIWKEYRGRYMNRPVAQKLLEEGDTGPIDGFVSMRGDTYAGRVRIGEDFKLEFEAVRDYQGRNDEDGQVAPELISYEVDPSPFVSCPKCDEGRIVETPTHYECRHDGQEKGCGVTMPRTVCKREMRRMDLVSYFDPDVGHTDWIEDFVSKKGRNFTARLVRQPNGRHRFEFKPREGGPRRGKRKTAKKKTTKRKTAAGPRKSAGAGTPSD